jgi:hypothetical protein
LALRERVIFVKADFILTIVVDVIAGWAAGRRDEDAAALAAGPAVESSKFQIVGSDGDPEVEAVVEASEMGDEPEEALHLSASGLSVGYV